MTSMRTKVVAAATTAAVVYFGLNAVKFRKPIKMTFSVDDCVLCGIPRKEAEAFYSKVEKTFSKRLRPAETWTLLSTQVLKPSQPPQLHKMVFDAVYAGSDSPPIIWTPGKEVTNVRQMMKAKGHRSVEQFFDWARKSRSEFWLALAKRMDVRFSVPPSAGLDVSRGVPSVQYFPGAEFNIADSCFKANPNAPAIKYRTENDDSIVTWTYKDLENLANRVSNALMHHGFKVGDAVGMCMPMTAESVAIYLGVVKAGLAVVSIADSFSASEIEVRMTIAKAKAMFTQDNIYRAGKVLPLMSRVVASGVERIIVIPGKGGRVQAEMRENDMAWGDFLLHGGTSFSSVQVTPHTTSNILFSSGTTGTPKAIPWNHATPVKAAGDGHLHHNINSSDTVVWPTNIGWMMGPWLIYASLMNNACIGLYYGSPVTRGMCEFIQDVRATFFGVVPSLVKAYMAQNATEGLDWSSVKRFSSTGESSSPKEMFWLCGRAGYSPCIEYCGGTEIGGGYVCGSMDQPQSPSLFSTPAFGLDFHLLDPETSLPIKGEGEGEIALVPASVGLSVTLLNRDHNKVYFAGMPTGLKGQVLRRHGDHFQRTAGNFYRALGRCDDTMNLGGIKVSSVDLERQCNKVEGVRESAAIAIHPPGGGPSQLLVYTVLNADATCRDEKLIMKKMNACIKSGLNPLFRVSQIVIIDALPRTASNKVMRRVLRDLFRTKPPGGLTRVSQSVPGGLQHSTNKKF